MPINDATITGYDGEIDAIQWARLNAIPERGFGGENDWAVSPIAGQRRVIVAEGMNRQAGVLVSTPRSYQVDVPAPGAGQWYVLVARRDWASKSFDFALALGPATSTAVPDAPPLLLPATLKKNPGAELDRELAWLWVASNRADVLTWDWRHDRPRPFQGLIGSGTGSESWAGTPLFPRSLYSIAGGRVFVDQVVAVRNNGDRIGSQLKRPFRAAPGVPELSQEGRGALRRPGGVAYLFGMTGGRAPGNLDEIRFDMMSTAAAYVGQTNIRDNGPMDGWRAGDYLALKYDYVPAWPLTPAL